LLLIIEKILQDEILAFETKIGKMYGKLLINKIKTDKILPLA
jgi:hypothetical protein